mmetsp:Transcript_22667/g.59244  ORF Transcript_22667/g.59244 Transcript_22667/m.59244 type:complete len:250 (-) Transcript_22667:165-914(-)
MGAAELVQQHVVRLDVAHHHAGLVQLLQRLRQVVHHPATKGVVERPRVNDSGGQAGGVPLHDQAHLAVDFARPEELAHPGGALLRRDVRLELAVKLRPRLVGRHLRQNLDRHVQIFATRAEHPANHLAKGPTADELFGHRQPEVVGVDRKRLLFEPRLDHVPKCEVADEVGRRHRLPGEWRYRALLQGSLNRRPLVRLAIGADDGVLQQLERNGAQKVVWRLAVHVGDSSAPAGRVSRTEDPCAWDVSS